MTGSFSLLDASLSFYKRDTQGIKELFKSEAFTVAAEQFLELTVRENCPDGFDNKSITSAHTAVAFSAAHYIKMKGGLECGLANYGSKVC